MNENEILDSLDRLQDAFSGNYGHFPLTEGNTKVGMVKSQGNRITISYRGSVNSLFEVISCLFIWKKEIGFGLKGKVHAGIHRAFEKITPSLNQALKQCQNPTEIIVEGYSRGSGLAAMTALFLKTLYPDRPVHVLTYSSMKIFDLEGAHSFEKLVGNHHLSFLCKEDFFHQWVGPTSLGYHSTGRPISFTAFDSMNYRKRVERNQYTYLMRIPLITWLIQKIIPSARWEAHMPQVYQELAHLALRRSQ